MKDMLLIGLVVLVASCDIFENGLPGDIPTEVDDRTLIEYRITGTMPTADITVANAFEETNTFLNQQLPYKYTFFLNKENQIVSVSAQLDGTGTITVGIYHRTGIDPLVPYKEDMNAGINPIASVAGTL